MLDVGLFVNMDAPKYTFYPMSKVSCNNGYEVAHFYMIFTNPKYQKCS